MQQAFQNVHCLWESGKRKLALVNSHRMPFWLSGSSSNAATTNHTSGTASSEARAASRALIACPAPSAAPTLQQCQHRVRRSTKTARRLQHYNDNRVSGQRWKKGHAEGP
jgi:hypothetical protein